MKTTIRPVRHTRGRWIATDFSRAQAYELWTAGTAQRQPRRLGRRNSLAEVRHLAELLEPARRTREQALGCRYSDVQSEVAARNPTVLARSLYEHERS